VLLRGASGRSQWNKTSGLSRVLVVSTTILCSSRRAPDYEELERFGSQKIPTIFFLE
jgi:hypothetical protein